jgi:hypothetical protein
VTGDRAVAASRLALSNGTAAKAGEALREIAEQGPLERADGSIRADIVAAAMGGGRPMQPCRRRRRLYSPVRIDTVPPFD